jgi:hypothetical protein
MVALSLSAVLVHNHEILAMLADRWWLHHLRLFTA